MSEFGPIFWITALVLVGAYVTLEIDRGFARRPGTILRKIAPGIPIAGVLGCEVEVALDHGPTVQAKASGCALCQSPMHQGTRVWLIRQRGNWIVDSANRKAGCGGVD